MEIRDIKQKLTILAVLQHYGLKTNKHDMLCCPFHEDKEPSLKVYPKTDTFNCFGCQANGDVIEFIQLKENVSKHEAILKATAMINPSEIKPLPTKPKDLSDHLAEETPSREGKIELLTRLFNYFRGAVNNSKPAREYIAQRKLELFLEIDVYLPL